MNTTPPTPANANRLAVGLARARNIQYTAAEAQLRAITLRVVADVADLKTAAQQAALLTVLNTGRRAFLGGVQLVVEEMPPLLHPLARKGTWAQAFKSIGFSSKVLDEPSHTIYLGTPPADADPESTRVYCSGWRGGSGEVQAAVPFQSADADDFALGGIYAGASAVHRAFVRVAHLPSRLPNAAGLCLWEPGKAWTESVATSHLKNLPRRFWLLGLGHLGQSFLWNLAFLPYSDLGKVEFLLQDFDVIDPSNDGSGLLCTLPDAGKKKARHCATWLEEFGFSTTITERRFGETERRSEHEPGIGLCGFDKAKPRTHLERCGLDLVVECGLGGSLANFDQAEIHVFPSRRHTAQDLWGTMDDKPRQIDHATAGLFGENQAGCGALAVDIAGKSVSTSFVGAMAGALVVAELLRTFNRGSRFDYVAFDARLGEEWNFQPNDSALKASQIGSMGYQLVAGASGSPTNSR